MSVDDPDRRAAAYSLPIATPRKRVHAEVKPLPPARVTVPRYELRPMRPSLAEQMYREMVEAAKADNERALEQACLGEDRRCLDLLHKATDPQADRG